MGKILIILLLFLTCELMPDKPDPNQKFVEMKWSQYDPSKGWPYHIVIIDSCEYIFVQNGNASWGSHKGNCKFCAERARASK
jgi:hypothetical protein